MCMNRTALHDPQDVAMIEFLRGKTQNDSGSTSANRIRMERFTLLMHSSNDKRKQTGGYKMVEIKDNDTSGKLHHAA
jgi:hypothetical protein